MPSKKERRKESRAQRIAPRRRQWFRAWWSVAGVAVLLLIAAVVVATQVFARSKSPSPNPSTTPTAAPSATPSLLAPAGSSTSQATVDGIQCASTESVLFHIHAHLAVYVDGQPRTIPEGIGMVPPRTEQQSSSGPFVSGAACLYWLHSHTADGIIHVESPVQRDFTLGEYFDIWGQPLSKTQVGPATGTLFIYVNGSRYTGDPRNIPLTAQAVIQIDVGQDVAPQQFTFPADL